MEQTAQDPYAQSKDQILNSLDSKDTGLSESEARSRLEKFGANVLTTKNKISAFSIFLEQFKNSLILILIGSVFLILFIYFFGNHDSSNLVEAALIRVIVLKRTLLGFFQEY